MARPPRLMPSSSLVSTVSRPPCLSSARLSSVCRPRVGSSLASSSAHLSPAPPPGSIAVGVRHGCGRPASALIAGAVLYLARDFGAGAAPVAAGEFIRVRVLRQPVVSANLLDPSSIKFLSSDELQFIPSFLTVISLLFSILAGNACSSLYQQQETIYFALHREVSEAKSLL